MSHYASGTRFEHKCRDDLEANGYDVIRAAGSKGSTKVDLAAFKPGQLLLIQAKANGAIAPAEWDRVLEVAGWVGAVPILAANGIRGRGVTYIRLLGRKRPGLHMKNQACEVFHLDQIVAETGLRATQSAEAVASQGSPSTPVQNGSQPSWLVARDADKPCQECDRLIQRGQAYVHLGAGLYEHVHCPDQMLEVA